MAVWLRSHVRRTSVRSKTLRHVTQSILNLTGHASSHVSLTLAGTTRMRGLNRRYRQRDYATDVLAFPMRGAEPHLHGHCVGDVVICVPVAIAQAPAYAHTPDEELLRLLIHGILHLLGYDHETTDREARRMKRKERAIFQRLIPVPQLLA